MKKIVLICPFFGTLPKEWFQLTLNSCKHNKTIHWLLFTDDKSKYRYPENVEVHYVSWNDFKEYVLKKVKKFLNDERRLNSPYKLCDYRPLYGLIFHDFIKEFDYWGNTDLTDVVYGDLRSFLTDDVMKYDKVNFLGHLTIYKNSIDVNKNCLKKLQDGTSIRDVLRSDESFGFDEAGALSIQSIYNQNNLSFVRVNNLVSDISPMRYNFQLSHFNTGFQQYYEHFKRRIFLYNNGHLRSYFIDNDRLYTQEYGYVHFQKRRLRRYVSNEANRYLIVPRGFISFNGSISKKTILKNSRNKIYLPFFRLKWKAFLKKLNFS